MPMIFIAEVTPKWPLVISKAYLERNMIGINNTNMPIAFLPDI